MAKVSAVLETKKEIMLSTFGAVAKLKINICWEVILFQCLEGIRGLLVRLPGTEESFREHGRPGFKY